MAKTRRTQPQFELTSIAAFDARRGYTRCSLPGIGVSFVGEPGALADFWRDRSGKLVVRFSSRGYVYHMEAHLASGGQIPEGEMGSFGEWVRDAMVEWIVDGVDDMPEPRI